MTMPVLTVWERRITSATLVFHLVDRWARDRQTAGSSPLARGPIRYRIVAIEAGGQRTDLEPPFDMMMVRNASGYDLWFGLVGGGDRYPHPPPSLVIEIASNRYQRVETVVANLPVPGVPQQFALEPGYAYEFPRATSIPGATGPTLLRGTLLEPDGTGVGGASVRVSPAPANQPAPNPTYVTDGTGNWVLPFDDAVQTTGTANLEVTFPGPQVVNVPGVTITRGDTRSVRQASLAGITRGATGAPLPGVAITLSAVPGISTTSDADGRWELWLPIEQFPPPPAPAPPPAAVTATPPQGATLQEPSVQIQPRATTTVDPFVFP
jgi:hypothetical protein